MSGYEDRLGLEQTAICRKSCWEPDLNICIKMNLANGNRLHSLPTVWALKQFAEAKAAGE